ncbi:hypothetical protein [Agrobacterium tumefaciens]|uniref:hypothetical protein n=1 Tax=Agrobacterium tumefaciens TaxID=358 RepID=UPI0030138EB7
MVVRHLIHLGYRYRLHRPGLPGKPDLVFLSRMAVIFVHGCSWHQLILPARMRFFPRPGRSSGKLKCVGMSSGMP